MRLRNFYLQKSNSSKPGTTSQLFKSSRFFAIGLFCMLLTFMSANPAFSQAVTRTSTVIAGASPFQDSLWTINSDNFQILKRLSPSMPGFTINGINSIATDPMTGTHYCILKVSGPGNRRLATINIQTGVCSLIGDLGDRFSTLAFNANGSLFGVTGNGATVPEMMYRINKATAAKTPFRNLAPGQDGEIIVYNTDDDKFYHWSGNGTVVLGRFDTTGTDVIDTIPYTGTTGGETFGGKYLGAGQFLMSNISSNFRIWTVSGATATIGSSIFNAPDDLRGLVLESHTTIIDPGGPLTICPGASVNLAVTGGTGGYQWYMNGSVISGATNDNYDASATGIYNCIYADINGVIDSPASGIPVNVIPAPPISYVANPAVCYGATSTAISYSTNTDFSFTGSSNTYHVPAGVTSVSFDILGAGGGNDTGIAPAPGKGGRLQGTLTVTPGDALTVNVGGAGSMGTLSGAAGGFNGGGNSFGFGGSGGGATDIRLNGTSLAQRVAVAGGGAGSGHDGVSFSIAGGAGGSTTGGDGEFNADGHKATGGSPTAGGLGAIFTSFMPGMAGMSGAGGDGSVDGVSGGGGGGYYGGGGGAWSGGGGGSSFADALLVSGVTHTSGFNAAGGDAKISFAVPPAYTYSIVWDAPALTAGFTNVSPSAFPTSSSFPITIPGTATPDTYTGTLLVSDGVCTFPQPISVTVKPIPDVNPTADQGPLCNATATTDVNFSGSLSGTQFNWTSSLATVGIPTSGSGDILSFTAINTSSANQIDTIIVTPELNGCFGPRDTFTYTVKPTPSLVGGSSAGYVCDNTPFTYTATSPVSGTTFAWSRDVLAGDIVASSATGAASINETFDNTGDNPVGVTYTYTLTANGCSTVQTLTVTVNPTPSLLPELVSPICSGQTASFAQLSNTIGLMHSWSRAAFTGITPGASSGTGLVNQVVTNTTPDPITITYIDTMNINGCKYTTPLSILVNPMPTLTTALAHNRCDNVMFNYKAKTLTTGTIITWDRAVTSGLLPATSNSGTDTIAETFDNVTSNPITVTYTFSLAANGCTNFQNVLLTVNPTPQLTTNLTPAAICDSTFFDYTPSGNTTGAIYTWSRANVTGIANPAATGTGSPHERLRNQTALPVSVTYVYSSTINGCSGTDNVVVVVNPTVRLSNTMPAPICDSTVFNFTPASFTPGYTYTWSRPYVGGIGALAVNNATGNISELLKNNTNNNLLVNYIFNLTANGCPNTYVVPLIVHPTPKLSSALSDSACSGAPYMYTPTTDLTPAVTFAWTRAAVTNITPATGSGSGNVNETLVNATTNTINVAYIYTTTVGTTGNFCSKSQTLNVKVRPAADAPVIGTMPGTSLCSGAMYQNFGASVPAAAGVTYAWSATNAEVYAIGTGKQYSLINFNTPGTSVVTLSAKSGTTGCVGIATYTVTVGSSIAATPAVIYVKGKFVCLASNAKSYQWGYDNVNTLDSTIATGEINQSYIVPVTDFANKYYWVMVNTGDCISKVYYNKAVDNTPRTINDIDESSIGITVFPNPANDQVNVEMTTLTQNSVRVELLNMLGQVLNTATVDNNKASFSVSNLPAGFYMIDCYQDGIKIGTAKFVKN